jgi:ATP-dependent helicase/nuclease subunit B
MERRLCAAGGNTISAHAEVLSFTRLYSRVFSQTGGLSERTLDAGGRILVMKSALSLVSDKLNLYARPSGKAVFLQGLVDTVDELKHSRITPEALRHAAGAAGGRQGEKLRELSLIYESYAALTARIASDPRDRLERLAERLQEVPFAEGIDFWLDGFTDFTPQELRVLQELLRQARTVTVGLVCDRADAEDSDSGIFSGARKTAASLLRTAQRQGLQGETELLPGNCSGCSSARSHLCSHLLDGPPVPFTGDSPEIELFEAETPFYEVEYAASRILRLVREEKLPLRNCWSGSRLRGYGPPWNTSSRGTACRSISAGGPTSCKNPCLR